MIRHRKNQNLLHSLVFCALLSFSGLCQSTLTQAEANAVLVSHNQVRSGVASTAANMTRLVWDANLATVAQNWANQCNFSHNPNSNSDYAVLSTNTGQVGENIFVTTTSRANALTGPGSAVPFWASEGIDYNFSTNTCADGKVCGHYTQLVWANTLRVGCGIQQCPTIAGLPSTFNNGQLVVCNYNPAGNFIGQSPYIGGVTGSQCPPELPNVVDGLCSPATTSVPFMPESALIILAISLGFIGVMVKIRI
jgi:Cysteine-rich secretory protein family